MNINDERNAHDEIYWSEKQHTEYNERERLLNIWKNLQGRGKIEREMIKKLMGQEEKSKLEKLDFEMKVKFMPNTPAFIVDETDDGKIVVNQG